MMDVRNASSDPKKGLSFIPAGTDYVPIIGNPVTGEFFKAPIQSGANGVSVKDDDFSFALKEDQVLEYICFKKASTDLNIKIGTTNGGEELFSGIISDAQPVDLKFYAEQNEVIYVSGIVSQTTVKIKVN